MKLSCLNTENNEINPKPSTRLAGKYIPGGCCRRRRKLTMPTNRGMVVVPRGWFDVVRKKFLVKTKLTPHNKNIIIIHNNTSIASNEEDNRKSSCVEPGKDLIVAAAAVAATTKIKDGGHETRDLKDQKLPPGDGVIEDKPSMVTTANDSGGQENGLKDQKKESDGGDVEDYSGMMTNIVITTKNEDGNQEKDLKDHNEIDDETIVEEILTLPDVDAEADPSASSEAVAVDSGIGKEEAEVQAGSSDKEKAMAAIRIQTAFRGHLARRALRALKGLVKLQAVVRGVVVRRQARMALHCIRALVRLGDRVRARQLPSRSSDE